MGSIENFVKFEEVKDKKDETILLIDGHNIAYITVFSTIHSDYSDNGPFILWRHSFINRIFKLITELKPTKVVLAFDTKGSWRYDIYDAYKANRKKQTGRYPLDKELFMVALNKMMADMRDLFTNMYVIHESECEGDDIIAVLAKDVFNKENENVIIVSGDTDLNQLLSLPNTRQWNPMKNAFYNIINPALELKIKILSGDKSDNISPIRRGVGVKTAEKILKREDGVDGFIDEHETKLEKKTIHENYERNIKLIDLDFIPKRVHTRIMNAYQNYETEPLDGKRVVKFFMKNRLHQLRTQWGRISKYLKTLE